MPESTELTFINNAWHKEIINLVGMEFRIANLFLKN